MVHDFKVNSIGDAVGMVKQPTSESSEFTMSSEDFPALPGTASTEGPSPGGSVVSGGGDKTAPTSDQVCTNLYQVTVDPHISNLFWWMAKVESKVRLEDSVSHHSQLF